MPTDENAGAYDRFARFYDKHWGSGPNSYAIRALPILDQLLLASLPKGGRILDLCCGNGQLAAAMLQRDLQVTGVDGSGELLRYARHHAPAAEFVLADARAFTLPTAYHGALSIFDSLNHMMSLEDLTRVFVNVAAVLVPEGRFVFDLNSEEGFRARWRGSSGIVEEDHACVIRSAYAPADQIARMDVAMFERASGGWRRADITFFERCYSKSEVLSALGEARFVGTVAYDAQQELGMTGMVGRTFFVAQKP